MPLIARSHTNTNYFLFILGVCLVLYYFYIFFTSEIIIHPEVQTTFPAMMANKDGSLWFDAIRKTFDMSLIESGFYRPRALGFFVHWLDVNSTYWLMNNFSGWGFRFPMTIAGNLLILFWGYKVLILSPIPPRLFEKSISFFVSASLLFTPALLSSSFTMLRSNKIISASICLMFVYFFLRLYSLHFKKKSFLYYCFIITLFFILSTIDEQAVAVAVFLFFLSLLFCFVKKTINSSAILFFGVSFLYFIWHVSVGKILFQLFTSAQLQEHPHQYGSLVNNFFKCIRPAFDIFIENITGFFVHAEIAFVFISISLLISYLRKWALIYCSLITLSFLLILSCCCAHYAIYYYTSLHQSIYAIPAILIAVTSIFNAIIHSGFARKKTLKFFFVLLCAYITFFHIQNYKEYQYALLSTSGIHDPISEKDKDLPHIKYFLKTVDISKLDDVVVTNSRPLDRRGTIDSRRAN